MYDLGVFDEDPEELQKRAVALMKQRDLRTSLKEPGGPGRSQIASQELVVFCDLV